MSDYNEASDFVQPENPPPTKSVVQETLPKPNSQSPQTAVDKFWRNFTTKNPGKVHSILPSDSYAKTKAKKSPKGQVTGQRAGKSYEQAVSECRNAVIKIAKECRRINAKYRDPHFDIEFDLKRGRRDCLDGLQLSDTDDRHDPRSVKRVSDIFKNPTFYEDDATASDIRQGFNGDYGEWIQTIVDDKLYLIASDWWESSDYEKMTIGMVNREDAEDRYRKLNQIGSKALYFAQCRSENETWLPLLEKAYAKAHGDFSAIDGGFTGEAIEDLTGGVTTELFTTDILDKDKFWTDELLKVNDEFLFGCATGSFDKWQGSDTSSRSGARSGIIRLHAYSIMDAVEIKGKRLVKVRNPWASDEWRGAWSDGSEQWTGEWLELLKHKFGDDGIFWISYEDLLQKYSNFDRTRLFGKEWQIVQQWTTINVPWTADYNDTKFRLTLTKRSPVVIVLSQLDERYFKGMTGQYYFELHFRLGKDGADDYIVRSHGNYSMRRSVSIDIELDPGTYSVLMRVTGQRYPSLKTPEFVIKEVAKNRQNKLIQVGLAYDLAHAKGEIRETEEEKQQRKNLEEKKKAEKRKEQRDNFRASQVKEFERKKRQKVREKRHAKRKEELRRKKAEKQKASEKTEPVVEAPVANGAGVAAGVEAEVDKQAATSGEEAKTGEPPVDPATMPAPPAETNKDKQGTAALESAKAEDPKPEDLKPKDLSKPADSNPSYDPPKSEATLNEKASSNSPSLTESALKSIPSVTINGAPALPSTAPGAAPSLAPGDAVSATGAPDNNEDDYDSSASFVTSIDSVLDFPSDEDDDAAASNSDDDDAVTDAEDAEFASDPWNAVCVVGLKVYSKDEGCSVKVVRPKEDSGEETVLDLDDVSKGASGEVEGTEKLAGNGAVPKESEVLVEVKTGMGE